MGIWIEFRCENRTNASSNSTGPSGRRCDSHDNAGPMELAGDTRENILKVLRVLESEARKDGWKKTRYGWICSYCASQENTMAELAAEATELGDKP